MLKDKQVSGTLFGSGAGTERPSGTASEIDFLVVSPTITSYNTDSRSPQSEEQQRIVKSVFESVGQVRRLTPKECLRLQGFPDDYLDVEYRGKPAADGPKYKAIGNSFAVNVVTWIGRKIQQAEEISRSADRKAA